MSVYGSQVAADGSDIVAVQYVQTNGTPGGASETFNVRGYSIDQGASLANAITKNTMTGNYTGNH
jgi:hypothetical protein